MAEQKTLQLVISKVDGPVFTGDVISVSVPGVEGEMTILAHHTALISPLKKGIIKVVTQADTQIFEITSGTLEISDNVATILI